MQLYQRTCEKTPINFQNFFKYHEIWNSGHAQLLSSQIKVYPKKRENFDIQELDLVVPKNGKNHLLDRYTGRSGHTKNF